MKGYVNMMIVIEHLPCAGKSRNRAQSLPLRDTGQVSSRAVNRELLDHKLKKPSACARAKGNRKQEVRRTPWEHGEAVQKMCFSTHVYLKGRKETVGKRKGVFYT